MNLLSALNEYDAIQGIEDEIQEDRSAFDPEKNLLARSARIAALKMEIMEIKTLARKVVIGFLSRYYVIQNGYHTSMNFFASRENWRGNAISENDDLVHEGDVYVTGQPDCQGTAWESIHIGDLCLGQWSRSYNSCDPDYGITRSWLQDKNGSFSVTENEFSIFLKDITI